MVRLIHWGLCLLSLWFFSQKAWAGPYDDGLEAYESGEYSKAYKILGKAVKKAKGSEKKAEALVLMGAAAAKLGKKDKARSLFSQAKKVNDEVELPDAASDDKTVKKLFGKAGGKKSRNDDDDDEERSSSRDKKGPNFGNVQNYFPFGINQFLQKKTLLAIAFGGAQGLGLFLYFERQQAISAANTDAAAAFNDYSGSNKTPEQTTELLDFLDGNEAYVIAAQRDAQLSLLLFAGAYAASVYEALYSPFGSGKKSALLDPKEQEEGWVLVDHQQLQSSQPEGLRYQMGIVPTVAPTLYLSLKVPF
jgi:hypothetical protein